MKDLLKSNDLLNEKRVIDAGIALGVSHVIFAEGYGRKLLGSLADVAFEMRDVCDGREWTNALKSIDLTNCPKKWIIAATLAWEAQK